MSISDIIDHWQLKDSNGNDLINVYLVVYEKAVILAFLWRYKYGAGQYAFLGCGNFN